MKKHSILLAFILFSVVVSAQHCPWDCSGMVLIETSALKDKVYDLHPELAGNNGEHTTDAVYNAGKEATDFNELLFYDDFIAKRKENIRSDHYYSYDTAYYFAQNRYVIRYNYCQFQGKKLYITFIDPYRRDLYYHYIEVPEDKRIHLHDFSGDLRGNSNSPELKKRVEPYIMQIPCAEWGLYEETDCR